ncbi:MAG: hypothetical protein ACXWP4_27850, partial [Polyangiales bacterium]
MIVAECSEWPLVRRRAADLIAHRDDRRHANPRTSLSSETHDAADEQSVTDVCGYEEVDASATRPNRIRSREV